MQTPDPPYALIVDDDPLTLMHMGNIIEEAGFRLRDACSGDKALALLDRCGAEVTLLFSDIDMDGATDGLRLAHKVAEEWPHIDIVIASGHVEPRPEQMPAKATFVPKPFTAETIHDLLRDKMSSNGRPAPRRAPMIAFSMPKAFVPRR